MTKKTTPPLKAAINELLSAADEAIPAIGDTDVADKLQAAATSVRTALDAMTPKPAPKSAAEVEAEDDAALDEQLARAR